jgi:hypothetical protein
MSRRESSYSAGFGGTFGVLTALLVFFVGLPMLVMFLFCGGCLAVGTVGVANLPDDVPPKPSTSSSAAPVSTGSETTPSSRPSTPPRRDPPKPPPANKVTLGNFNRVQIGMTMREVTSILGQPNELLSENRIGQGTQFDTHTQMFMWKGGIVANCNITFQNGKVMSKAQFGLTGGATSDEPEDIETEQKEPAEPREPISPEPTEPNWTAPGLTGASGVKL